MRFIFLPPLAPPFDVFTSTSMAVGGGRRAVKWVGEAEEQLMLA